VGPTLAYEDVVEALNTARSVPAWVELARLLDGRPGWRFRIDDGMTWWTLDGRKVHVCAHVSRHGRHSRWRTVYWVFQGGRGADDATCWDCDHIEEVRAVVEAIERRRPTRHIIVEAFSSAPAVAAGREPLYAPQSPQGARSH